MHLNLKLLSALILSFFLIFAVQAEDEKPSDAEITKIINATNEGEIEMAKVAKRKTKNEEIKTFADHMITEHTNNNKNSMQLVRKLNIKPVKNEKSEEMKKESEKTLTNIKDLDGKEFDKAYIDSQVKMHSKVLTDLDEMLIPSAKNPELKAMLEKTKDSVTMHLEQAKKIQSSLQ